MARKWTAAYVFEWTPILPYLSRRMHLLSWLDEHTSPVAFSDDMGEAFGISLLSPDVRLSLHRSGMIITTGTSGVGFDALEPAIVGVLEVMRPNDTVLESAETTWTVDIEDAQDPEDYYEELAAVARHTSLIAASADARYRPVDASVLVDFDSADIRRQVEWGVVSPEELRARISRTVAGRIAVHHLPSAAFVPEDLPPASYFGLVRATRKFGEKLTTVDEVLAAMVTADKNSGDLVQMISDNHSARRGHGELAGAR